MGILSALLWAIPALITIVIIYATHSFWKRSQYYKERGIPYLGTGLSRVAKMLGGSLTLLQMDQEIFREVEAINAQFAAVSDIFGGTTIYLRDLDLIKHVFIKDFDHFVNRRPMTGQIFNKYVSRFLFGLEGEKWKGSRSKLSPCFSTGRIRRMFSIFQKSSERMAKYISGQHETEMDFAQIFPKYSMDVIATSAFGVYPNCWDVPLEDKSEFERIAARFFQFQMSGWVLFKFMFVLILPKIANALGVEAMDTRAQDYFVGVIKNVIKRRKETGERHEDFLQLMVDTMDGVLEDEEGNGDAGETGVKFDEVDVIANAFVFMLAGFDTTQSVLQFVFYQLAAEPDVQERLFESVNRVVDERGGKVTYEGVQKLSYLDMVINETMRLYPPTVRTERGCTKDYTIPGSNVIIEKNTPVCVPIYCIQHDKRFFPEPEVFKPERFSPENKGSIHSTAFMPFGHGPRSCVGNRFALLNIRAAIAQLVYSFKWEPCSKTIIPLELDNGANVKPKGGMWLKVTQRQPTEK